jgi:hypothetical protein
MVPYIIPRMPGMLLRMGLHRKMADGFQDGFTHKTEQIKNRITIRLLALIDNISQSDCQESYWGAAGCGLRENGCIFVWINPVRTLFCSKAPENGF